jgi:hypothetical protein
MPGSKLSHPENKLIDIWGLTAPFKAPRLSSVSVVSNGNGLRGIKNLTVNLNRPITVLCGQHGSGKSTILALCRLAFAQSVQFDDLFIEINQTQPFNDFLATWSYINFTPGSISFDSSNRTYSAERPGRPVYYIGLSRVVPAWEKEMLVSHYRQSQVLEKQPMDAKHINRLKDTLNKNYVEAGLGGSAGYEIRTCSTGQSYTSFNMCAGEEALVEIYRLLQAAEAESLILIEDAEVGLNPVVITKFAKNLIDICLEKRLQVVLTTHSLDLITSFPSEFICLIKSDGATHKSFDNPSMQDVLTNISSQIEKDIIVFCEDDVAESLIKEAVPGDLRRRLKMVYGSKTKLLGYAEAHIRAGWPHIPIVIWDGDVTNVEIAKWLKSLDDDVRNELSKKVSFLKLPGTEPPERWILSQLSTDEGCSEFAQELNEQEMTTRGFLSMLSTMSEFHSFQHDLAQMTGSNEVAVLSSAVKVVSRLSTQPLASIRQQLERAANNEIVSEIMFVEQP